MTSVRNQNSAPISMGRFSVASKWVAAAAAAWLALHSVKPLATATIQLLNQRTTVRWVVCGAIAYLLAARLLRRTRRGQSAINLLMALEHELAHAFVVLLVGGRVDQLNAASNSTGHVLSTSRHWLVFIAPYVLPLAMIIPALLLAVGGHSHSMVLIFFGMAFAFHVHSSWLETHREQSDLRQVGFVASGIFIVSSHVLTLLWVCGCLLDTQQPAAAAIRSSVRSALRLII